MSGPLLDKQQKMGENVENIKFSLDTQLKITFSVCVELPSRQHATEFSDWRVFAKHFAISLCFQDSG